MDAADLTLPPELRDVVFGEVREGTEEEDKARTARLANIAGDVDKLKDMEVRSQQADSPAVCAAGPDERADAHCEADGRSRMAREAGQSIADTV